MVSEAHASKPSRSFVNKASIGNQFEIDSSRLALQNSKNSDVKQFAQEMVDDHTQLGNQLVSVLSASNADMPVPDNKLDAKHQKVLDRLQNASTTNFDMQYIMAQVDAHNEAISLFKDYSVHGDNPALKDFATQSLPMLQKHKNDIPQMD